MKGERECRLPLVMGLSAFAVTAYQLVLMQLLSYVYGYHFAYLVLSLALLGFGTSGAILYLCLKGLKRHEARWRPILLATAGLVMGVAPRALDLPLLRLRPVLLFQEPAQWAILAALSGIFFLPFFAVGLFLGYSLSSRVARAGPLYAADLAGSGLGGAGGLMLVAHFLPWDAALVAGAFLLAAATLVAPPLRTGLRIAAAAAPWFLLFLLIFWRGAIAPGEEKGIYPVLSMPDTRVIYRAPETYGVFEIIDSPYFRDIPGLSLAAPGAPGPQPQAFLNGDPIGRLGDAPNPEDRYLVHFTGESLGYAGLDPMHLLYLESEGGWPLELGLLNSSRRLTLAEPVTGLAQTLRSRFLSEVQTGRIEIENIAPRAYLARDRGPWSLVRFPTLGRAGGSHGFSALGEDYLFTREGVRTAWNQLEPDGRLLFTVWPDYPPRNLLKLLTTLRATLDALGIEQPRRHLAAWRGWGSVHLMVARNPIPPDTLTRLRKRAEVLQFDLLLLPGLEAGERERFHQLDDPGFFPAIDSAVEGEPIDSPFRLVPPWDNRPFFHQYLRLDRMGALVAATGWDRLVYLEMGTLVAVVTVVALFFAAMILIGLPLGIHLKRTGAAMPGWVFVYFAGLGAGFMAVEIALIQKLVLLLGNPLRSAALVLTLLLVFSGVGSFCSSRLRTPLRYYWVAALLTGVAVLSTGLALRGISVAGTGWFGFGIILAGIALMAFCMGFPFPWGFHILGKQEPSALPWAWGINGCFSVLTPPVATLLAVEAGFQTVFLLAAGAYFSAALALARRRDHHSVSSAR